MGHPLSVQARRVIAWTVDDEDQLRHVLEHGPGLVGVVSNSLEKVEGMLAEMCGRSAYIINS